MIEPTYPPSPRSVHVDTYHGIPVPDAYRWLEDEGGDARRNWIAAQRAVTEKYLSQLSARSPLRARFAQLLQYPRWYDILRRGDALVYRKNEGLDQQLKLYAQQGLTAQPRVLVDPIAFAADGTTAITGAVPSDDMRYITYGRARGGSDWQEYVVLDLAADVELRESLQWVKATAIAWRGHGFYYSRYPAPTDTTKARVARNEGHQVWYHRVNTPQADDTLVWDDQAHPLRFHFVETTPDSCFAILSVLDGGGGQAGNAVWVLDMTKSGHCFVPVRTSFDARLRVVGTMDGRLLVLTNCGAPNSRLVSIDPADPDERAWREVIPESRHQLQTVTMAGGRLFASYRRHGAHRVRIMDEGGGVVDELRLPGIGAASIVTGGHDDTDALWTFASFTTPMTVYRYDITRRESAVLWEPDTPFKSDELETERIFYRSRDGTRVPMFIVHQKGIKRDGQHPALLEGYGGGGMSMGPTFDPLLIALLERGVVYALACLRGGGEYGEAWHRAGVRDKKQNVFDDCIAAASWLQTHGYTSPDRCAITGASNGGLLVGAVITQRPELFRVAMPRAAVLDMLRFHQFTTGWSWIPEYGSSDDPEMVPVLLAYSPVHNVRPGTRYPATLVALSEHDDRVVPAHSFKFVASLQHCTVGPEPCLIRIDRDSGHSPVSLQKAVEERVDLYSFMLAHMPSAPDATLGR